ncbi:MAG: DHHC palmitoyltransferase-domain-containing protein [Benjaminiella poitrasii]|nr:MAG: DHHC palmitoyltransferase-domain-containing protein [Benjaminiella poitrasii]
MIALALCTMSWICYIVIMLKPAIQLPLNNTKFKNEDVKYNFPNVHNIPSSADDECPVVALSLSDNQGGRLYCSKCKSVRPERTHHCKECQRCVPKMDHHCLWINGCVDDSNYKCFFLFVFYVAFYCLWAESDILPRLLHAIRAELKEDISLKFAWRLYKLYLLCVYHLWKNVVLMIWYRRWIPLFDGVQTLGLKGINMHWYILAALGILFGLAVSGFALVHLYYILKNQTSIEYIADRPIYVRADFDQTGKNFEVVLVQPHTNIYDIGYYGNWCSVMGSNPFLWFIPIKASGDHCGFRKVFPYNANFCDQVIKEAQSLRKAR